MTKLVGIDISAWQGNIDFSKVKNEIDFCIIRTVSGKFYDKRAKDYINGCYKNKIPYGLYCAAYPLTIQDAIEEAEKIAHYAEMAKPLFPIYYDYEGFSLDYARKKGYNHSADTIRQLTSAFCERLEQKGFFAGVYANLDYTRNIYNENYFKRFSRWLAYWGTTRPISAPIWQFSNNGTILGIKGRVDKNICYYDFPALIAQKHFNGW